MSDTQNKNVVIAEDSPVQGVVLRRVLVESGYTVHWGKNGKLGYELVEKVKPVIVITDIEMPEMNGFELCSKIKNSGFYKDIPVIICSSLSQPEDIMTGIACGADGYVTKPYDKKYLMYRVRSLLENPIHSNEEVEPIVLNYAGKKYKIVTDRLHILNMLMSTYENSIKQYNELVSAQMELKKLNQSLDVSQKESQRLLLNILPAKIAEELKKTGKTDPVFFKSATILFTDFKGFTKISEQISIKELISDLDAIFREFDTITSRHRVEKLKTIGDSYMCVAGIPEVNDTHPTDMVEAAIEMREFMKNVNEQKEKENKPLWNIRIGIHTGPIVAGVVGKSKFCYDIWGDSVNTASRMESSGEPGKINISNTTYDQIKDKYTCEHRGKIPAKNKGEIDMYFLLGPK